MGQGGEGAALETEIITDDDDEVKLETLLDAMILVRVELLEEKSDVDDANDDRDEKAADEDVEVTDDALVTVENGSDVDEKADDEDKADEEDDEMTADDALVTLEANSDEIVLEAALARLDDVETEVDDEDEALLDGDVVDRVRDATCELEKELVIDAVVALSPEEDGIELLLALSEVLESLEEVTAESELGEDFELLS